jgi:hypothetical protein
MIPVLIATAVTAGIALLFFVAAWLGRLIGQHAFGRWQDIIAALFHRWEAIAMSDDGVAFLCAMGLFWLALAAAVLVVGSSIAGLVWLL